MRHFETFVGRKKVTVELTPYEAKLVHELIQHAEGIRPYAFDRKHSALSYAALRVSRKLWLALGNERTW